MITGNSGAAITLVKQFVKKSGGVHDLYKQAMLLKYIGTKVCPRIIRIEPDGYLMEKLYPLEVSQHTNLADSIMSLLKQYVWRRFPYRDPISWIDTNREWCKTNAPWIPAKLAEAAYSLEDPYCLIHGDPTFGNAMEDGNGDLKLIDAIPPRPGIPEMEVVDVGKILQSIAGWEHFLDPNNFPKLEWTEIKRVLDTYDTQHKLACLFWAAFHGARIIYRSTEPSRKEWGKIYSMMFVEETNEIYL